MARRSGSSSRSPSRARVRVRHRRAASAPRKAASPPDLRGRRFTPEQRADALQRVVDGLARVDVAASIGTTTESLRRWFKSAQAARTLPPPSRPGPAAAGPSAGEAMTLAKTAMAAARPLSPPPPATSAPKDPGAGLGAHETQAILDYKRKHPSMGPAQIRAQLKRFLGWRISVKAIARVLRQAGFPPVHTRGRPVGDEHPGRFEAPHRNALWQMDFTELRVGPERRYLLVIEDDFSRFVVSHALAEGPTSEVVVAALTEAIRLHGKPERVYTDRGAAFTAWRDISACEQFLDGALIDHSLRSAHRPKGGGKIESVLGTVQRELWEVCHFDSVADAQKALAHFFVEYNHRRAHMGIGGLVPADRFYGRWPEVQAEMDAVSRRRQGALALHADRRLFVEPPSAAERVVAFQLVVVGDEAELWLGGRRVRLGRVLS